MWTKMFLFNKADVGSILGHTIKCMSGLNLLKHIAIDNDLTTLFSLLSLDQPKKHAFRIIY